MFGLILIMMALSVYGVHYVIFQDAKHLLKYGLHEVAFVFVEVLLVTLVLHRLMEQREKMARLEKMNMVIETFFSEVGTRLLTFFSDLDPSLDTIRKELVVTDKWTDSKFGMVAGTLKSHKYEVQIDLEKLVELRIFLMSKRDFLVGLLQNPMILEHEEFTELLRSVFHMTEELTARQGVATLPGSDATHVAGDIKRAYRHLVHEWLAYMKYLKNNYPYLFSFAMRTNPFDRTASLLVQPSGG